MKIQGYFRIEKIDNDFRTKKIQHAMSKVGAYIEYNDKADAPAEILEAVEVYPNNHPFIEGYDFFIYLCSYEQEMIDELDFNEVDYSGGLEENKNSEFKLPSFICLAYEDLLRVYPALSGNRVVDEVSSPIIDTVRFLERG